MLGTQSGSATVLPRSEGAADERFSRIGQRLTQPAAVSAPVLTILPVDPIDDEIVVAVVGTIALHRSTHVEFAVQFSNVAVAQDPRAGLPAAFFHDRFPSSFLVDHVQIKKRGLLVAEYTRASS